MLLFLWLLLPWLAAASLAFPAFAGVLPAFGFARYAFASAALAFPFARMKKTMVVVVMVGCGGGPLVAMVTMGWRCVVMVDVKIPDRSRFRVSGFGFR